MVNLFKLTGLVDWSIGRLVQLGFWWGRGLLKNHARVGGKSWVHLLGSGSVIDLRTWGAPRPTAAACAVSYAVGLHFPTEDLSFTLLRYMVTDCLVLRVKNSRAAHLIFASNYLLARFVRRPARKRASTSTACNRATSECHVEQVVFDWFSVLEEIGCARGLPRRQSLAFFRGCL